MINRFSGRWIPWLCLLAFVGLGAGVGGQEVEPDRAVLQMLSDLMRESDPQMRAVALEQIRHDLPGEKATEAFAAWLSELSALPQLELLDALAQRGDPTAAPAVRKLLDAKDVDVSVAAIRALARLGDHQDVDPLISRLSGGAEEQHLAAEYALSSLQGDQVDTRLLEAADQTRDALRASLYRVLTARGVVDAVPLALASATDESKNVRLAAVGVLRALATDKHIDDMVRFLDAQQDAMMRYRTELAILAVAARHRNEVSPPLASVLPNATPGTQAVLMRALARTATDHARETLAGMLRSDEEVLRLEAVRLLSGWPDATAAESLREAVDGSEGVFRQLALRGLVRLSDRAADQHEAVDLLGFVLRESDEESIKRMAIGALGNLAVDAALQLVRTLKEDSHLRREVELAEERIRWNVRSKASRSPAS